MSDETSARLAAYLQQAMSAPFKFGATDCSKTANGWIRLEAGISPLDAAGYEYDNESQSRAITDAYGGLARATINAMRKAGLRRTRAPKSGDVGIVEMFGKACVAIFDGRVWVSRDDSGLLAAREARVVAAWGIN